MGPDIEADKSFPDIKAIRSLTRALGVSAAYLVNADNLRLVNISPRNAHRLTPNKLREVEIIAIQFAHSYLDLEAKLDEFPAALGVVPMRTPDEAEQAALHIRALWDLGDAPIKSLTALLEGRGIKILRLDIGRCDGLALHIDEDEEPKAQIILVAEGMPIERRRFTLAHELAHLLAPTISEDEADHFAGAFLLPAEALRNFLPRHERVTVKDFIALKEKYGVSLQAIIKRCKVIGLLNDEQVKHFNKACDYARTLGDADLSQFSEVAVRFDELLQKARAKGLVA